MKYDVKNFSVLQFYLVLILVFQSFLYAQDYRQSKVFATPTASNLTYPQSIFIDSPSGHIWVTDFDNHRVLRFDVSTLTSINETTQKVMPEEYFLGQNYPNPFNAETQITFSVKLTGEVVLSVYDLLGQKISILFDGVATANTQYSVSFNAKNLTSGVYLYSLRTISGFETKQMCLLK